MCVRMHLRVRKKTPLVFQVFEFVQDSTKASLQRDLGTKDMGSEVLMNILIEERTFQQISGRDGSIIFVSTIDFRKNIGNQLVTLFCKNPPSTKFCGQKLKAGPGPYPVMHLS